MIYIFVCPRKSIKILQRWYIVCVSSISGTVFVFEDLMLSKCWHDVLQKSFASLYSVSYILSMSSSSWAVSNISAISAIVWGMVIHSRDRSGFAGSCWDDNNPQPAHGIHMAASGWHYNHWKQGGTRSVARGYWSVRIMRIFYDFWGLAESKLRRGHWIQLQNPKMDVPMVFQ